MINIIQENKTAVKFSFRLGREDIEDSIEFDSPVEKTRYMRLLKTDILIMNFEYLIFLAVELLEPLNTADKAIIKSLYQRLKYLCEKRVSGELEFDFYTAAVLDKRDTLKKLLIQCTGHERYTEAMEFCKSIILMCKDD